MELIDVQTDITINKIIDKLSLKVTNETVRKAVLTMGYRYKKKSLHASEDKFINYLKNVLAPTLQEEDIVIMDNLQTYRSYAVK